MSTDAVVTIRPAQRADCQRMYDLIMELAVYEKAPESVIVSKDEMEELGFGERPLWSARSGAPLLRSCRKAMRHRTSLAWRSTTTATPPGAAACCIWRTLW